MDLTAVPRVPAGAFRAPRCGGAPRVVTGMAQHWQALRAWTPAYLKQVAGAQPVMVRETSGPPRNFYQNMGEGGRLPFADYLDWVVETANGSDLRAIAARHADVAAITRAVCASGFTCSYYLDVTLAQLSATLLAEVDIPAWYRASPVDIIFWCGILGTSSGLHFDLRPNCNVQVRGRKKFILFPPSQARAVYRIAGKTHCHFDPNLPDLRAYPRAAAAHGMQCELQPGEALYIPPGWFHQVTVMSPWAINVNFFWPRPFPQGLLTPVLWQQLLLRARARCHVALRRLRQPGR